MASSSLRCLSHQLQQCCRIRSAAPLNTGNLQQRVTRAAAAWQPQQQRYFSKDGDDVDTDDISSSPVNNTEYSPHDIMASFDDTSYYDPVERADYSHLTIEELKDSTSIPGWDLLHSPPKEKETIPRGALVGTVVSTKMQKTVNVSVDRFKIHPKYRKRMRFTRKFMAHDEAEVASAGDLVMIVPSHRISKHKHFMLREIIRAKGQL
jgi:small subunit ribosomal protein S17